MSVGLSLDISYGRFTVLFCCNHMQVIQINLWKESHIFESWIISQWQLLIVKKKKKKSLTKNILFQLPLLLKFEIFPIDSFYWRPFPKNKNLQCSKQVFYVNTICFSFSQKSNMCCWKRETLCSLFPLLK